jgi:glutamyl/glutaminyl-tRNA synthetase
MSTRSAEQMREGRGTLTEPGPRLALAQTARSARSLALLRHARRQAPGGQPYRACARIDMASPNMNLRDPAIYRIRFAEHHRTGNTWCIYPMYDYAHPISDALENITHSICTLEFEDHRPLYDWLLERHAEGGFFQRPLPQQIEFARLNLGYTITSKRKLQELVANGNTGRRLGRSAHADHRRACAVAATRRSRFSFFVSGSACRGRTPGSTWACSSRRCAMTSRPVPHARSRCSIRCGS